MIGIIGDWMEGSDEFWDAEEDDRRQRPKGEEPLRVPFLPIRCPRCRSQKPVCVRGPTRSKDGIVRYHLCKACEIKFQSVEVEG